jgi:hypothetical protein
MGNRDERIGLNIGSFAQAADEDFFEVLLSKQ